MTRYPKSGYQTTSRLLRSHTLRVVNKIHESHDSPWKITGIRGWQETKCIGCLFWLKCRPTLYRRTIQYLLGPMGRSHRGGFQCILQCKVLPRNLELCTAADRICRRHKSSMGRIRLLKTEDIGLGHKALQTNDNSHI